MTGSRAQTAVEKARSLARSAKNAPLELAEALFKAEQHKPGSVKEIVATTRLGRRKAYYLLEIWKRFGRLGLPNELLAEVGWKKLVVILQNTAPGKELAALELAKKRTVVDLPHALLKRREPGARSSTLLRFSPKDYKVFARELQIFGAKPSVGGRGLAQKEAALIKALNFCRRHRLSV